MTAFIRETIAYSLQIKQFTKNDWIVYTLWVGLMFGLLFSVSGFLLFGHFSGVTYPSYVWNIPIGTFVFVMAISFDTIGHRTTYKDELLKGEALVHHVTIFAGITSTLLLCLAYTYPEFMRIPALVMIAMSVVYSLIDEVFHWRRYIQLKSDRVEMWAHFFIFVGHFIFVGAWWYWFTQGYAGVAETLVAMENAGLLIF
jgi:hypothetical protein